MKKQSKDYLITFRNRNTGEINECTHCGADATYAAWSWYKALVGSDFVAEMVSIKEFSDYCENYY